MERGGSAHFQRGALSDASLGTLPCLALPVNLLQGPPELLLPLLLPGVSPPPLVPRRSTPALGVVWVRPCVQILQAKTATWE